MLILHDGELLHTDSSTDILEHYGKKGMKWGKRAASYARASGKRAASYARASGKRLKDYGKEAGKVTRKSYTNPILSNKASRLATTYNLRKGNLSSALLVRDTATLKRMNDYVDDRVALKDRYKKQRKTDPKNKANYHSQYRRDVSDMNNKFTGKKGY